MMSKKRKALVKLKKINLTGDYEGWSFTIRTNPKLKGIEALQMADEANNFSAVYEALAGIIYEWNFVDEEGKELPQPYNNPDVFREISSDLLVEITENIKLVQDEASGISVKN